MPKDTNKQKEYWCECRERCGGIRTLLGRSAWYEHNPKNANTIQNQQVKRAIRNEKRLEAQAARQLEKGKSKAPNKGKGKGKGKEQARPEATAPYMPEIPLAGPSTQRNPPLPHFQQDPDPCFQFEPMYEQDLSPFDEPHEDMDTRGDDGHGAESAAPHNEDHHVTAQVDEPEEVLVEIDFDIPGGDDNITMEKTCKTTLQFINLLRSATLETSGLSEDEIYHIDNPRSRVLPDVKKKPWLEYALKIFIALRNSPKNLYDAIHTAAITTFPDIDFPSYSQVNKLTNCVNGVAPIFHDMCRSSCIAFTGPFENLDNCPDCGPSLQAFYAGKDSAEAMQYRADRTRELFMEFSAENGSPLQPDVLDDFLSGEAYLKATEEGRISSADTLLMFSIDGAQLYRYRLSDVWIYIWVVMDIAPDKRYKKKYVIPGGIIPGPNKPKNLESFVFPGLYHIAALQKRQGNLRIYDSFRNEERSTCPKVLFATADTIAMTSICGSTGHTGARGCRKSCGQRGRHCTGKPTYYPALKRPDDFHVPGSDFPDIDLRTRKPPSQAHYNNSINTILRTRPGAPYERAKKETGFTKPSLFLGVDSPFGVPALFPIDDMHLVALNLPDLVLPLWRKQTNSINCHPNDDVQTWDWATLVGDTWTDHGKKVVSFRQYLPSSYERPPRNPVEKLNSGYKASEFLVYFYGYLPILLPGILPEKYLTHFYKLVRAVRLFLQASITPAELEEARELAIQYVEEYEDLYVQRKSERLHFVRPCVHVFSHTAEEIAKLGPLRAYAQWTIERMIGILEANLRLHSNAFSNMQHIAIRYVAMNGLIAQMPELVVEKSLMDSPPAPSWSFEAGSGYRLLHPHDQHVTAMEPNEAAAFRRYFTCDYDDVFVRRSTRLQIPRTHVARSRLREHSSNKTTSRIVKIIHGNDTFFAEVLYYFQTQPKFIDVGVNEHRDPEVERGAFAMVSLFSDPDPQYLQETFNVLCICYHKPDEVLAVFPVHSIRAVVAALPFGTSGDYWYILEELGLDVSQWTGSAPTDKNDDDVQSEHGEDEDDEEGV
ncbi:hypothetical protein NP233_g4419 [Leucocoprinus birnbaumii]|uniref:Transposase family Tnp2 protein n=1 Tax=Leucocoprinus birnbaumii TaxID=56174 RepID=A0AAD5VW42_9AGAR|nr:hypothetical protein NP233_g4419 [Leucocoprinus birnbaumii]